MQPSQTRNVSLFQLITNEEVVDNRKNLVAAQEIKSAPPAFEAEKALSLGIDMGKEIRVLLPYRLGLQVLEILYEPGAIEPPATQIGSEMRQPSTAKKAA